MDTSDSLERFTVRLVESQTTTGVGVTCEDGSVLRTDVFRPKAPGPWPALVLRTPYGTGSPALLKLAVSMASAGWAVVLQNVRGRYGSSGIFEPFLREVDDGADLLRWLAAQPWFDGQVVGVGASYSSFTAAALALRTTPPGVSLRGIVSMATMVTPYDYFYRDGALVLHWALPWSILISGPRQRSLSADGLRQLARMPLEVLPAMWGGPSQPWREWLRHRRRDDVYWMTRDLLPDLLRAPPRMLHVAGWFDFGIEASLRAFDALSAAAPADTQHLLVGPWRHDEILARMLETTGPAPRELPAFDAGVSLVASVESWLVPQRAETPALPTRRYCRLERGAAGEWTNALVGSKRLRHMRWYLRSGGGPGSGRLSLKRATTKELPEACRHRPDAPVPSVGGRCWPLASWTEAGPLEQSRVESHPDVLRFTSAPLLSPVDIDGRPVVILWVRRVGLERPYVADFCARLSDAGGEDSALWVADGIVRLKWKCDRDAYPLHRVRGVAIDLGETCYRFGAGRRIRITISGSSFPQFDCLPVGTQHLLYHDDELDSHLILPTQSAPRGISFTSVGFETTHTRRPERRGGRQTERQDEDSSRNGGFGVRSPKIILHGGAQVETPKNWL